MSETTKQPDEATAEIAAERDTYKSLAEGLAGVQPVTGLSRIVNRLADRDTQIIRLTQQVADLEARNRALVEALSRYGAHFYSCAIRREFTEPCDCGLNAVFERADTPEAAMASQEGAKNGKEGMSGEGQSHDHRHRAEPGLGSTGGGGSAALLRDYRAGVLRIQKRLVGLMSDTSEQITAGVLDLQAQLERAEQERDALRAYVERLRPALRDLIGFYADVWKWTKEKDVLEVIADVEALLDAQTTDGGASSTQSVAGKGKG